MYFDIAFVGTNICAHKGAAAIFIKYYYSGEHQYARLLEAKRNDAGERYDILHYHLGRVMDEEKGIFKNRERGVFKYNINDGFADIVDSTEYMKQAYGSNLGLILDFGAEYVFTEALKKEGIMDIFLSVLPEKTDTLMTLVLHTMLWTEARQFAEDFWKAPYARIAFPNARLKSQRISEFLMEIGDEVVFRRFFCNYLGYITKKSKHSIIIDSTGLQNDINMDLTASNVHNGLKSNEVRLILAMDRTTGYPLYFRYVKGNILDVNSLANTLADLKQYGIDVDHCILDAGYYCGDNINDLDCMKIPYLMRLRAGNNIHDSLIGEHIDGLDSYRNKVVYGDRVVFIKCVPVDFNGSRAFAYVSIDHSAQSDERRKIFMRKPSDFKSEADIEEQLRSSGAFILISKQKVAVEEILPLYYSRQAVEQVFDFGKNYASLLPLRTHNEATFRGHLLISFIATVSIMTIDKLFTNAHPRAKNKKIINFTQARSCLRQMKCHVYDNCISVVEPDRKSNDVLKALKVKYVRSV